MQWLKRAQEINPGGGVSAHYGMDIKKWEVDYPETTGYIIPTFLCYYRLTGNEQYRQWAIAMGDWEITIQAPEGGVGEAFGRYGLRPRVFNTSQVILGWAALYDETGQDRYLSAACAAADWIVANQDKDGKWTANTYQGPKAYKSRVAWALLELYQLTGEEKYRGSAERSIRWVLQQADDNGWFENNSLTEPGKPWTHLIGYVLVGLLESYRLNNAEFDRSKMLELFYNAVSGLGNFYLKTKEAAGGCYATLPGTFDQNWHSTDNWSCITGNAQIAYFLRRFMSYAGETVLGDLADMLVDDIKQLQFVSGMDDPDLFGGLPGSFPVNGGYCAYMIPNWGVKFFADTLLQRLLPQAEQKYLG
jgi:Squalene-hopene cyclase C-terminal domain